MTPHDQSTEYSSRSSSRWLWLSAFTAFALVSLTNARPLLAAGLLLLAVFAFYNNPLAPTATRLARPGPALAISWACGLLGVVMVIAAAVGTWR